jgi:hypothetical protein
MLDALPKILIELREDAGVAAITTRIRVFEPMPDVIHPSTSAVITKGDARSGSTDDPYVAFVVLVRLDSPRETRAPIQRPRIAARCYGRTGQEAYALYAACSEAIHHVGPRVHANNLGIYLSHDDTGATQEKDPDTQQPYETFVIDLFATTQVVTA